MFLQMCIIAISLSIDAFGIGMAYALKKIEISWKAECVISLISIFVMYVSLKLGVYLTRFFSEDILKILGISFLVLIGVGFIYNSIFERDNTIYDLDSSKKIDVFEAAILGFVLSIDTVSVGLAIAALGLYTVVIPCLTGIMQGIFLILGKCTGGKGVKIKNEKICGIISGTLMICIAIIRGIS